MRLTADIIFILSPLPLSTECTVVAPSGPQRVLRALFGEADRQVPQSSG